VFEEVRKVLCDVLTTNVRVRGSRNTNAAHTSDRGVQAEVNLTRCINWHNWGFSRNGHVNRVLLKGVLAE
jgi:hypothetical protein